MRRYWSSFIAAVDDVPSSEWLTAALLLLVTAVPAHADDPWENAVTVLQTAFTGTIARGLSLVAIVVGGLMFAFGEGLHLSRFTGRELLMFAFFPLGVCAGMVVGWWREGLGGGITVASLVAFYLLERFLSGSFPRGFAFAVLAVPGILFLLCGLWTRSTAARRTGGKSK